MSDTAQVTTDVTRRDNNYVKALITTNHTARSQQQKCMILQFPTAV